MATAPYQLDELIASLKTSHIGNEAIELAKLQAQLQQSLQAYPQGGPFPTSPVQSSPFPYHNGPPANTPMSRTPSWAPSLSATDPQAVAIPAGSNPNRRRRRSSAASSLRMTPSRSAMDDDLHSSRHDLDQDMMEDVEEEAEVDASLDYMSSNAASPIQFNHPNSTFQAYSPTTLAYALNDPFLTHQLQVAEQRNRHPSYFAQLATAHQYTSPFNNNNPTSPNQIHPSRDSSTQTYPQRTSRLTIDTSVPFTAYR